VVAFKVAFIMAGAAAVAPFSAIAAYGLVAQPQKADVILVPGAALKNGGNDLSDALRFRMNTAIELWKKGYAPRLVLSGGGEGAWNEAEAMARYALGRGVPEEAIVLDRRAATSRDTAENLAGVLAAHASETPGAICHQPATAAVSVAKDDELVVAARKALKPYKPAGARVLVVSQWCHVTRVRMALNQAGFRAFGAACEHPQFLHNEHWMTLREAAGLWAYALRIESGEWREALGAE
jgi:uncharacterized SAM-binding protein YcdF (DUF218 family)